VTRLEGYRCDQCKVESIDRKNTSWIQVQTIRISPSGLQGAWSQSFSEGTQFCSKACLQANMDKWV
jgi:hypothetical protein